MMPTQLICPFVYSLLIGGVWSACFKKKFYSSLAPAYMFHILLVLLSGLLFKRLSYGIFGGIAAFLCAGIVLLVKRSGSISSASVIRFCKKMMNDGVIVFFAFYLFCFITNCQKRFLSWDEFSHWGLFLKESLRLDALYCMSPLQFSHKDYVPAITLFETIWCKLCGRYSEQDAYRGVQVFMFSMLMPMFERICDDSGRKIRHWLFQAGAVLLVLLVPLIFLTNDAFCFYHTIYCDIVVGIVFYWCAFEAYRNQDGIFYRLLVSTIGMSVLVLSKMTSMALMPLVVALFVASIVLFSKEKNKGKHVVLAAVSMVIPGALWLWFNRFVDKFVENAGGRQSYDGMSLLSIFDVFTSPGNSSIPYLKQVQEAYLDAVIHRKILIHGSYLAVVLFVAVAFAVLFVLSGDASGRRRMAVAGIWTILASVFYALLMYFLYCTAFIEYEAVRLASYERYMNSFAISIVFFLLAVYFDSGIWEKYKQGYAWSPLAVMMTLYLIHVSAFEQVLPGKYSNDEVIVSEYTNDADVINGMAGEDDRIYIIKRGDDGTYHVHEQYYCSPRIIETRSIGPAVDENDMWSWDLSVEEFVDALRDYDYIYFCELDEPFISIYSDAFDDPGLVAQGKMYRIAGVDSKVKLGK